jgi:hypothetical protein
MPTSVDFGHSWIGLNGKGIDSFIEKLSEAIPVPAPTSSTRSGTRDRRSSIS